MPTNIVLPGALHTIVNDGVLDRVLIEALARDRKFRAVATLEPWKDARVGETVTRVRQGKLPVRIAPLAVGQDITPQAAALEHYVARSRQHGDAVDIHTPTSAHSYISDFFVKARQLSDNATETLNLVARKSFFDTYGGGRTRADGDGTASTALVVDHVGGFSEHLDATGRVVPVSAANPLDITIDGAAATVVAVTPADAARPNGPGTLTLGAVRTWSNADPVVAGNASFVVRAGGRDTAAGLQAGDILSMGMITSAVARLRSAGVPTMPDGLYHCHLDPISEQQLMNDNAFTNALQGNIESMQWREGAIGSALGCGFYRNNEMPVTQNTPVDHDLPLPMQTDGDLPIHRPLVIGEGALLEMPIPEEEYSAEEQAGLGNWGISPEGLRNVIDGVAFIVRRPLDRRGQTWSVAWSWSGDLVCPSDATVWDNARFKRAVMLEHV